MTWTVLAAAVIGVLAVGRATRLLTHDDFPPVKRLRTWYVTHTDEWSGLMTCPFCLAPWLMLVDLTWAVWCRADLGPIDTNLAWSDAWWFANGWFAFSYLSSMLVVRDEPE